MNFKNKTKGLVAGAVGAAILVAGGATFALWSDSDSIDGGTITSGNLDVATVGTMAWQDVSPDVNGGNPLAIDLANYKIVPGDTVAGSQGVAVALEGDNLKSTFTVQPGTSTGGLLAASEGVTLTYTVTDEDTGTDVATDVPVGTPTTVDVYSSDYAGTVPTGSLVADKTALADPATDPDLTVTVKATFDTGTPDQVRTQTQADLSDVAVQLAQTRS